VNTQGYINSLMRDFLHTDIDGFDSLAELALHMQWPWNQPADELWQYL